MSCMFWKPPCSRNGLDGLLWEGGLTLLGSCCCLFGTWDVGRFLKQSMFYHLSSRWTSFPMLTRASLGEKYGIKPDVKNKKRIVTSAEQVRQCRSQMGSVCNRTLAKDDSFDSWLFLLLSSKIDEVGSHAVLLTTPQLIHTKSLEIKLK